MLIHTKSLTNKKGHYKLYFLKKYEIIFDNIVSDPVDWGLVLKIQLIIAAKRWI